jgi:hypothetical protein
MRQASAISCDDVAGRHGFPAWLNLLPRKTAC